MTLVKADSNEVLLKKEFYNEFKRRINGYPKKPAPESMLNYALATTVDDVFKELALEVSQEVCKQ